MTSTVMLMSAGGNKAPTIMVATMVAGTQSGQYVGFSDAAAIGTMTPNSFALPTETVQYAQCYVSITGGDINKWDTWLIGTAYAQNTRDWLAANCKFFWFGSDKIPITWGPYDPANKTYYVFDPRPTRITLPVNGQSYKVGFSTT